MDDSTSDCQLNHGEVDLISDCQFNHGEVDFEFESNEVPEESLRPLSIVDEQLIPKDVGAWIISKVMLHHSHPCCPTQAEMLKQHRELSMSVRRTIENNKEASIKPSKAFQSFVVAVGGHRELNFIEKDVRNYITREVRNVSEQEYAKEFGKYLLRMKEKNQNFFFELELEDDQLIKLAFWADARSRAAFEYFRDVISFDTTYNTNRYNLVCGSFVGVNHHGQSILLGCALMKNEEIESFEWLFQCWLRCMGRNAPKGFLTDQCASMKRAIKACMPTTIHCWCIWHITKKIPSKLNGYKGHAEIEQELSQVVWNSHSKDSFDRNWNDCMLNFGLVENKWLSGMKSTQRSESMHSFFNKFITRNSSLIQFVKQYDNCLGSRKQAERESDAADFHMVIPCATKFSIEAQFQDVYTHQKFREVQAQFRGKANCITRLMNSAIGYLVFEVGDQVSSSIFNKFVVTYDSVAAEQNICKFTSESDKLTAILHRAYDKVMVEMEELKAKRKGTCSLSHEDANLESVNEFQSPPRIRTRGHPKNRLGSKLDKQIANASKKKKTKDLNELNLFHTASVVHPNSSQYQGRVMNC
ncbi:protein FAR-RED IMPAIRED RESPONSE 1-like [Arachis stenosperma]|uniref:protein FAR-RED IMPAIRED RESPONSE 1-like n=1 Tax=Arachis stenosperma TaxID=217475 RepID=UPI0025AC4658|nr:protein FAR-RED IMPAIRED RESPONSE 1-like [Arachis stenosperma]